MIGEGLHFEQHEIGAVFRTLGRTVSETDIVSFVNLCGFTEPLFMDMEYVARESVFKRRAAPGALTFALSEGLVMQTGLIHGTGMAYPGGEIRATAPVLEGDTLTVEVEVADKRETKEPDRGIVTYRHRVLNQRGELVLEARSADDPPQGPLNGREARAAATLAYNRGKVRMLGAEVGR